MPQIRPQFEAFCCIHNADDNGHVIFIVNLTQYKVLTFLDIHIMAHMPLEERVATQQGFGT